MALAYTATELLETAKMGLLAIGYQDELLRSDYRFADPRTQSLVLVLLFCHKAGMALKRFSNTKRWEHLRSLVSFPKRQKFIGGRSRLVVSLSS